MEITHCIFIVDDDESVGTALRRLMKSYGFSVKVFNSGTEFLGSGNSNMSGCLILDVCMPGLGGLELQDELISSGSNMPVIFITGHDNDQVRIKAMEKGAVAYLKKPINDEELLSAISVALDYENQNDTVMS